MKKNENSNGINHSSGEIDRCISVLENLVKDTERLVTLPEEQRIALLKVAGKLSRPDRAEIKKRNKMVKTSRRLATREKNRRARETTGIRHARTHAIFSAPKQIALHSGELEHEGEELSSPRNCYICKEEFRKLHFFYDTLCNMLSQESVNEAVADVRAIYHICPNMHPDELAIGQIVVASAKSAGCERFVYHSVLHPQIQAMPHHWNKFLVEEHLFESGLSCTILQPAAYMQNILANWHQILAEGIYSVPYAADTRLSMVDLEDVVEVATTVLTELGHEGRYMS